MEFVLLLSSLFRPSSVWCVRMCVSDVRACAWPIESKSTCDTLHITYIRDGGDLVRLVNSEWYMALTGAVHISWSIRPTLEIQQMIWSQHQIANPITNSVCLRLCFRWKFGDQLLAHLKRAGQRATHHHFHLSPILFPVSLWGIPFFCVRNSLVSLLLLLFGQHT